MNILNDKIDINDTNYKNYSRDEIKKNIDDKSIRDKFLKYHYNKKYYNTKQLDENKHIKKKHCDICNVDCVLIARHNITKTHQNNLNKSS